MLKLQSQLEEALATQMAMQRKLHEQLEVCERSACGLAVYYFCCQRAQPVRVTLSRS